MKNKTANAIQAAIQELTAQIRILQDAIRALQAVSTAATAPAAPVMRKAKRGPFKLGRDGSANLNAGRKLVEPFTALDLAAAAGLTEPAATSQLYRWCDVGFVEKVAPGVFKRSTHFPQN